MINSSDIYNLKTIEHKGEEYEILDADIVESDAVFTVKEGKIYVPLIGYDSWFGLFSGYDWKETDLI